SRPGSRCRWISAPTACRRKPRTETSRNRRRAAAGSGTMDGLSPPRTGRPPPDVRIQQVLVRTHPADEAIFACVAKPLFLALYLVDLIGHTENLSTLSADLATAWLQFSRFLGRFWE